MIVLWKNYWRSNRSAGRWVVALLVAFAVRPLCAQQPNVVIINIDDMGWGDFGAYGSQYSQTPNIDALANQGTRFTQFYSGAPICSPSRATLFTGQYGARSNITTFINDSVSNLESDNANHLSLSAPSMARTFHDNGYATGHFGKWHLGGGRDVGYAVNPTAGTNASAPRIVEYGYDEAWTQMEGLANRIINVMDYGGNASGTAVRPSDFLNGLNQQSNARGTGGGLDQLVYLEREFNATFMIERAIDFVDDTRTANPNQPFFMNVWLDETHTPHDPPAALKAKYDNLYPSLPAESRNYLAVLEHADQQIGRLVDHIDQLGLGDDTLILVTADNGAVRVNANNIDSTGPFRGTKGDLFEGGIRQPLIARWTGSVAANRTDIQTVMSAADILPTLIDIAALNGPAGVTFDGENLSDALLGQQSQMRTKSLFWNMNRGTSAAHTNENSGGAGGNGEEVIGLRTGNWKLLLNAQGTAPELYDVSTDLGETNNVALQHPQVVQQMAGEALAIRYSTPSRTLPDAVTPLVRLKAENLAGLGNNAPVGSWSDTATGDSFNGTVTQSSSAARPTLLTSALNGRAVVSFDGDDVLASATTNSLPNVGQGITVIAVATKDASGAAAQRLGQIGDNVGTSGQVVGLEVSGTSTSTSNGGAGYRFNNGASLYDTPLAETGFHIVAWQVDHGQSYADARLFVDGTLPANTFTGSSTAPSNTISFSGNDLELLLGTGRSSSGDLLSGDLFNGQLAEFLVFNEQLSAGQINLVANYLSTEYGLPFAYKTNLSVIEVEGLSWNGGAANFGSAWNQGDGSGGPAGSNSDPFVNDTQTLYLGNNGIATFDNSTNTAAGNNVNAMRIGTGSAGLIVNGTEGNGTLNATGSKSLTIGNGAVPTGSTETGDLSVGEAGYTGAVNWNSTGTLKVEGRLRVGDGGVGVINQDNGIITAGDVAGSLKFIAIGSGAGSSGTYNLNNGRFLPGGGTGSGTQLRHLRIAYNGANGSVNIGDGIGAGGSASVESRDDLYVGYDGGDGSLTLQSDGQVLLVGDNAPVYIGFNSGSNGVVTQHGGMFRSDAEFVIGNNSGAAGLYELDGGTLHTADDGAGQFRVGRSGGSGTLRVGGTGVVIHEDTLTLADGGAGTEGVIEMHGNTASLTVARFENTANGSSEVMHWSASAAGISPIVVNGNSGSNRVQLQDPAEVLENGGVNGGGNLTGDGVALSLDLSALTGNHMLTLIDNQTSQSVVGFFEDAETMNLYEEGESIANTGFFGTVTISYVGGTGNDVTLSLVASSTVPGDHNADGAVDAADYVAWRKLGTNGTLGYTQWQNHFGMEVGSGNYTQVPEPAAWILLITGTIEVLGRSYRQLGRCSD